MSVSIKSGATSDVLTVDATSKAARTTLYNPDGTVLSKSASDPYSASDEGIPIVGRNDDNWRVQRMDRIGSSAVALNNILFHEPFEVSTMSVPNRLTSAVTTFAMSQTAAGGLTFNNANVTTAAAAALLTTNKRFLKPQRCPLHLKARARFLHQTNATIELGFGLPANQASSPTTGAFFQCTPGGVLQGVLTHNSIDITTSPIQTSLPGGWQSNFYIWDIILDDEEVAFMVQDSSSGAIVAERRIQLPSTQSRLWDASHLPAFARLHFPTAPATAANLNLTSLDVVSMDAFTNKSWAQTMSSMGFGSEVNPAAMTQTANWANSTAPISATLSNTAAGYATLGGLFQFTAVAGAITDFALFGFTVPAPYSFICTGIQIDTWNTGAAVATTPTLLNWFVSPDQLAISLATASNRRTPLGAQSMPIGTVPGAMAAPSINVDFSNGPMVTNAGRLIVIGMRCPIGTATASQIVQGMVSVKGYFE